MATKRTAAKILSKLQKEGFYLMTILVNRDNIALVVNELMWTTVGMTTCGKTVVLGRQTCRPLQTPPLTHTHTSAPKIEPGPYM